MSDNKPYIRSLTGAEIPIKTKEDPTERKDLTPSELKIYRFLRSFYPYGKTEKQIQVHPAFKDIATIGNKLRSMRQKGCVESKKHREGDQTWHAKPLEVD